MINFTFQFIVYSACLVIGASTSISMDSVVPLAMVAILIAIAAYVINTRAIAENTRAVAENNRDDVKKIWEKLDEISKQLNRLIGVGRRDPE